MEGRVTRKGLLRPFCYVTSIALTLGMLLPHATSAEAASGLHAIPDYGNDDCVSFKQTADTNELNFKFGYACVSAKYCEVSAHGCGDDDKYCEITDYSRGARTALTNVPIASRIDDVILGASGRDLRSDARWCLVKDGGGNFWALDKQRGQSEQFNLNNLHETVVPCKPSDYFQSDLGCLKSLPSN